MKYGKVVYTGDKFKVAIANYPTQFVAGIYEYAVFKSDTPVFEEVGIFLAKTDQEAVELGIKLANKS